jgi:hypothetical protein
MWFLENVELIDGRFVDKARGDPETATRLGQDEQLSEADRDVIVRPD